MKKIIEMRNIRFKRLFFMGMALLCVGCTSEIEPYGPVPTEAQLAWQRMEINMFCHFGPNTFTGKEWGDGTESEELFNPTALDCRQWVDVAEQAGMGGIIITAKHHDGFCLWPSAQSTHTVAQSPWRDGKGDVLRELRDACQGRVKMGVYVSPWDRNHPTYGTPEYNTVFANTLREVHEGYGPLFEQWFDGACGEGPNGKKQEYDWPLFNGTVASLNPDAVIFSDYGPGCRWVGNEEGRADTTCWSTLDSAWVPVEADVSIRPGWFWHADEHPKSVDELMEIYYNTVGRNSLLLLNVPPDNRGLIPAEDSAVLVAFRRERDRIFANDLLQGAKAKGRHRCGYPARNMLDTSYHTYWASKGDGPDTLTFIQPMPFTSNLIVLQEYIPLGQRVTAFHLEFRDCGQWWPLASGTTIGHKRFIRLPSLLTSGLRLIIDSALAPPVLNRLAIYSTK